VTHQQRGRNGWLPQANNSIYQLQRGRLFPNRYSAKYATRCQLRCCAGIPCNAPTVTSTFLVAPSFHLVVGFVAPLTGNVVEGFTTTDQRSSHPRTCLQSSSALVSTRPASVSQCSRSLRVRVSSSRSKCKRCVWSSHTISPISASDKPLHTADRASDRFPCPRVAAALANSSAPHWLNAPEPTASVPSPFATPVLCLTVIGRAHVIVWSRTLSRFRVLHQRGLSQFLERTSKWL
jgi:hypothetical protein